MDEHAAPHVNLRRLDPWLARVSKHLLVIAIFFVIGLRRGRASPEEYLFSPFTSLLTLGIVGLLMELLGWVLGKHGVHLAGIFENLISLLMLMFGGFVGGLYWAARGQPSKTMRGRGALVFDGAEAQRHARRLNSNAKRGSAAPLTIAGIPVPFEHETEHFKFMGTTGAGKTTAIQELLDGALRRGDRTVIADPDGGYLAKFYDPDRGDVILNPFDPRAVRWDLFGEMAQLHDADQLSRSLIADAEGNEGPWRTYARVFLTALLRQLYRVKHHEVGELYSLISTTPVDDLRDLRDLLADTPAGPYLARPSRNWA